MARMKIRDNSIWLRHLEGDVPLQQRLASMRPGQVVELEVGGVVGRWERMRTGRDGRATQGIKPIDAMRDVWKKMQSQRGRFVEVRQITTADTYLASVAAQLTEWDTPEDEEAYRDL